MLTNSKIFRQFTSKWHFMIQEEEFKSGYITNLFYKNPHRLKVNPASKRIDPQETKSASETVS